MLYLFDYQTGRVVSAEETVVVDGCGVSLAGVYTGNHFEQIGKSEIDAIERGVKYAEKQVDWVDRQIEHYEKLRARYLADLAKAGTALNQTKA